MTENAVTGILKPKSGVVHTEMEAGAAVLLDMETHRYFSLNESGSFMWRHLSAGTSVTDTAALVAERYSLGPEKALKDTEKLVSELSRAGLLLKDA